MDREIKARDRLRQRLISMARPVLLTAGLLAAALWTAAALRPSADLDQLRIAAVERGDLEAVITALGTVEPAAERVMTSPVDARILRILRRPGTLVEKGDALFKLDLSATELELSQVEGRLTQARARRLERQLEIEKERNDLLSRRQIAELELEEAEFSLEQSQRLHGEGLISISTLRASETRSRRLKIQIAGLETALANAQASAAAQLAGLDAEIHSLEDEQAQIRRTLERATGRAERAGVLTWVLDEEGGSVLRGDALARLADLGSFRIEASVSDVHAQRLEAGFTVRVPLGDESLQGQVSRILPTVEDGALRFIVDLDQPGHPGLRPSLRLDVFVVTATRPQTLKLARGPFATGARSQEIFVLDPSGHRAQRRRIEIGLVGERSLEIVSGLDEGERVILSDLSRFNRVDVLRVH